MKYYEGEYKRNGETSGIFNIIAHSKVDAKAIMENRLKELYEPEVFKKEIEVHVHRPNKKC